MPQLVDVVISSSGIRPERLPEYIDRLINKTRGKCQSPYMRIVLEGSQGFKPVELEVYISGGRVIGEKVKGLYVEGELPDDVSFTMARVECLSASELARELARASKPRICSGCGSSPKPTAATAKLSLKDIIRGFVDSKLSMRLVADPFWYTRLLMKAQKVLEDNEADVDKALATLQDMASRYEKALIVLQDTTKELRIYVNGDRIGIGLVEGGSFEIGMEAVNKARGMRGRLEAYQIISRTPTLTI